MRIYLAVPYAENDNVKNLGACWDKEKRSWFFNFTEGIRTDVIVKFQRWIGSVKSAAKSATNAHAPVKAEFTSADCDAAVSEFKDKTG